MQVHLQIERRKWWLFTAASAIVLIICAVATQMASVSASVPNRPVVAFLDPLGITRGQVARLTFFNATGDQLPVLLVIADLDGAILGNRNVVVRPGTGASFDVPIAVDDVRGDQYGRIEIVGTVRVMNRGGDNNGQLGFVSLEVFDPVNGQTINRTGDRSFFIDETG